MGIGPIIPNICLNFLRNLLCFWFSLNGKFSASSNELCTTLSNANSDVSSGVLLRVVTAHVLIEEVRIAQSSKLIKNISSDEIKSEGHNNSFGMLILQSSQADIREVNQRP